MACTPNVVSFEHGSPIVDAETIAKVSGSPHWMSNR